MNRGPFPRVVWEFLAATNAHDLRWLESLFAGDCVVVAFGHRATGLASVERWIEENVIVPELSVILDDVFFDGYVTVLGVRACDHGSAHECLFEFRTDGRYIQSLTITDTPPVAAAARQLNDVRQAS